jgi:hypothetical protein
MNQFGKMLYIIGGIKLILDIKITVGKIKMRGFDE